MSCHVKTANKPCPVQNQLRWDQADLIFTWPTTNKAQIASLDFVINRFFMKLFSTINIEIVKSCQEFLFVLIYRSVDQVVKACGKICNQILQWDGPVLLLCLGTQRLYVGLHTVLLT